MSSLSLLGFTCLIQFFGNRMLLSRRRRPLLIVVSDLLLIAQSFNLDLRGHSCNVVLVQCEQIAYLRLDCWYDD